MNTKTKEAQRRLFNTVELARRLGLTKACGYPLDKYGMIEVQEVLYYAPTTCTKCDLFVSFISK